MSLPLLAPIAERTASSRSRPASRAIINPATFAHAISKTARDETKENPRDRPRILHLAIAQRPDAETSFLYR